MKRTKQIIQVVFLIFLIAGSIWIVGKPKKPAYHSAEGHIYGTSYHIKYEHTEKLDAALYAEMKKADNSLSMFNKNSTISRINSGASDIADSLVRKVFGMSQEISRKTGGAFDVTVAPLVDLWGFGRERRNDVSKAEVDSILSFVGISKVDMRGDTILREDPRTELDFSAIAKGLGVDLVAEYLDKQGVENYFIEIGGELVAKGKNASGENWTIGINQPATDGENGRSSIAAVIQSEEKIAVATSGNYNNFYIRDGKKIAHTINPLSGYPSEQHLLSVTVLAPSCAVADAYATAFMVMGTDSAENLLATDSTLSAFFIYADSLSGELRTKYSEGFKKHVSQAGN